MFGRSTESDGSEETVKKMSWEAIAIIQGKEVEILN